MKNTNTTPALAPEKLSKMDRILLSELPSMTPEELRVLSDAITDIIASKTHQTI